MRKITSNYIIVNNEQILKNGIIIIDENNFIIEIIDTKGIITEIANLEYYSGIICPAFIDTLCFLSYPDYIIKHSEKIDITKEFREYKQNIEINRDLSKRAINHLDAFGTAVAADFLSEITGSEITENTKAKIINSEKCSILNKNSGIDNGEIYIYNRILCNKNIKPNKQNINNICLSTGSLKTHKKLSIFNEIIEIQLINKELNIYDLVKMATINGAIALGVDKYYGSLEVSKQAKLNIISNYDIENFRLKKDSKIKVLI